MKAITYSLFGYGKATPANCFEFDTYVRGLMVNVRFNRILYPNWVNVVSMDPSTYTSPYQSLFEWLQNKGFIEINIEDDDTPLCLAMLWRLKAGLAFKHPEWTYTHVLNRDIDSISTYREAQAVAQWIKEDKAIHCITDSISHNIPMMGGMIGFRPAHLGSLMNLSADKAWPQLMQRAAGIDFNRKGSDQDFLNRVIYPSCFQSSTEHFILGMKQNVPEENGRHYLIEDIPIDVDPAFKASNDCAGHIGAAGFYEPPTLKFLRNLDPYLPEYVEIEKQFPKLFYWSA
jgi:hypothetical protein